MTNQDTNPHLQAVRRLVQNKPINKTTNDDDEAADTIYLVCHSDPSSGKDIILWDDILAAFKEDIVIHVRSGAIVLPFLKGSDFKNLDPLRIAAVPNATLDVVVRAQVSEKEQVIETPQREPSHALEASSAISASTNNIAPTTVRRNPVGGLVEQAMDAYRDNINPAFGPRPRGPQAIPDEESPSLTSDTPSKSLNSASSSQTHLTLGFDSPGSGDFHETMNKAKLGDKDAQYTLGDIYYYGKGAQQDYQSAMEWYIKAANQGHAEGQNSIGFMYHNGQGVPQDYAAAIEWYRKAADQGLAAAQINLAYMYLHGLGVPQDYSAALDWYHKAANQGHMVAQNGIGFMYHNGQGVPQDYAAAMEWYHKAANNGFADAFNSIGHLY
ncbi:hypothetical protein EC991_006092, partial [Linnemannia zychae]